jgi:ketosteroid isomerase-like protein
LNPENPKAANPAPEQPDPAVPNPEIDAFFERLPGNLHWPVPSEAAIAAAVEAIQRISGGVNQDRSVKREESGLFCGACGLALRKGTRFCGNCGVPVGEGVSTQNQDTESPMAETPSEEPPHSAQHHYHHHYHHFVGTPGSPSIAAQPESGAVQGRAAGVSAAGTRAGIAARQLAQDWAQACNTRHLDDLVELYVSDATLIRSNVPPVRSAPAIREFLFAILEAGLGEVEMESLRTEIFGEIALDLGRCKMLVPVAMGKRREERGKYLLVMARQPAGNWKIIADCWSADLSVSGPESARRATDLVSKKPQQP